MPSTAQWGIPYPELSDAPDVPTDTQALAESVDELITSSTQSVSDTGAITSPAVGQTVYDQSTALFKRWSGTSWAPLVSGEQVIARGVRTTDYGPFQTQAIGILRLDNVALRAGRVYRVEQFGGYIDSTGSDGTVAAGTFLTYNAAGTATTASTRVPGSAWWPRLDGGSNLRLSNTLSRGVLIPASSADYSILLAAERKGGQSFASNYRSTGEYVTTLLVTDIGAAPADTGVVIT